MKAIACVRTELADVELEAPVPARRDVVVEVRAVSVNPVDTKVRRGHKSDDRRVLGWDAAGVVVGLGPEASSFAVGDEVWFAGAIGRAGTNAQRCAVDERIVARKPKTLDFAQAAALPLTTLTAYEAFFDRMRIGRGEASRGKTLLVVGGAGGVASIAIQLARVLTETTVIATAGREESRAWVKDMGAHHVVDHRSELRPQIEALGLKHVDYVLCTADTDPYFATLADLVAPQGFLCFIVAPTAPIEIGPLQRKSVTVAWELMFTRAIFETSDMGEQGRLLGEVAALVDAGRIRTTMTKRLAPITARTLREAHALIESGATVGKIVLEGW
jgi:zinc-binding alcohol dehydrogenase family protein